MGNGVAKVSQCFVTNGNDVVSRRHDIAVYFAGEDDLLHEGLGHSFCYFRPDPPRFSDKNNDSKVYSDETTTFRSISGASVSANTSTPPLSTALVDGWGLDRASTFESSVSFASMPLQPVPRGHQSGSLVSAERGFLSGPMERWYSGPVEAEQEQVNKLQRSMSHGSLGVAEIEYKSKKKGLIKNLKKAISRTISRGQRLIFTPIKRSVLKRKGDNSKPNVGNFSAQLSLSNDDDSEFSLESQNLQWAQGKAGEDRVHIVISEEHEWVFVGIYDGFNGPDAPDYLLSNLYANVQEELRGLLWNDKLEPDAKTEETEDVSGAADNKNRSSREQGKNLRYRSRGSAAKGLEDDRRMWRCECDRERVELDWKIKEKVKCNKGTNPNPNGVNHFDVLRALSRGLRKTEGDYLEIADTMARENPELALMGSCVLVMLMKGEDVYLMNVGDSRAVLAQRRETKIGLVKRSKDLGMISEETMRDLDVFVDDDEFYRFSNLNSLQLTKDHSTYVDKEVERIKKEHPDDASAVMNDRVKGYLKVTRAFGVGFLKQPKWNDLLLEMFRIDYIGTSPYITCFPSLYHHRLTPRDRFLILSSDGLYQYFTNEEAVSEVDMFISAFPEGDPAQHLIEEVLFRAAKKAGMDFHELLEIPPGDRRRYHDDVSVIIISLEGRIWRSSV